MLRKVLSQSCKSIRLSSQLKSVNFTTFVYSNKYEEAYINSVHPSTMEKFWQLQAQKIAWIQTPHVILEQPQKNQLFQRWFVDGKMNMSYNCIDRHLTTLKDSPAILYESPLAGISETITYQQLHERVVKFAGMLKNFNIKKGDVVLIHMPNIPEAVYAMLACARIGAIHTFVFGGFSAAELANRIKDSNPKLILSASVGYGVNRQIDYKIILDNALKISNMRDTKCIIVQRPNAMQAHFERGVNFDYNEEMEKAKKADYVEMHSTDPLYILYTSGQGASKIPRGVVRDNGGTAVALTWAMNNIFDVGARQTMFAASDLGWVVGHQFGVYGPLLNGASTVLYEGKPTGTPDAGIYWKLIEKHKARSFFTFPTSVRSIKNVDPEGNLIANYNISSLQSFHVAGERCDIQTYNWITQHFKSAILNDNYWQTESGWPMISNFSKKLHQFQPKQGSTTKPVPGFNIKIFDEQSKEAAPNQLGNIVIKLPLPPSFVTPLNHQDQFKQLYLDPVPGFYFTGDSGYKDGDGYIHIMTKSADVINISGHRLSSISLEQALMQHKDVAEAAVVGLTDEIKGEVPIGFVVVKSNTQISSKIELQDDLIHLVRHEIGPIAYFQKIIFVKGLPKTKAEKVLRQILSSIVNGEDYEVPNTLKDPKIVKLIEDRCNKLNLGKQRKLNIQFESASKKNTIKE